MKDKKSKRELILDSALSLFLQKGYDDTKIIEIAEKAGIGKGTVYEYFKSKELLFAELFQKKIAEPYNGLAELLKQEMAASLKLRRYIEFEMQYIVDLGNYKNVLPNLSVNCDAFKDPLFQTAIHQLIEFKFRMVRQIVVEGIDSGEFWSDDPTMTAVSIMGSINFFVIFNFDIMHPVILQEFHGEKEDWQTDQLMKILLKGISAKS